MKRAAPLMHRFLAERIGDEIVRMMTEGGAARGMDLMVDSGLMEILLPEVRPHDRMRAAGEFHPEGDVYCIRGLRLRC